MAALKKAYAPDQGDLREHNATETSLGFGLLHYALVRNLQPDLALALGSRYGFVPACIALALKANGKGRLHFVDANYSDQQDGFSQAYGGTGYWSKPAHELFGALGLHEWIDIFIERTDRFYEHAPSNYGYVYIDANHSLEGVRFDCQQAMQRLAPGGMITFHDAMIDEMCAESLPGAAEFGVKAYLKQRFPNAIVLNRWPGLALVQPAGSTHESGDKSVQAASQPVAALRRPEEQTPSQMELEHRRLSEKLAGLEQRLCEHDERLRSLVGRHELPNGSGSELNEALNRVRQQLREHDEYYELIARIRNVVNEKLPANSTVAVASKGDDQLISFTAQKGRHFPSTPAGLYAGEHPADSTAAIAALERERQAGAQYLLFPKTSLWWMDCYPEFRRYLEDRYRALFGREDTCLLFSLNEPPGP